MITLRAPDEDATRAIAGHLARALAGALRAGAMTSVVVGLRGPLGAGKTAFTRGFVAGLDPDRETDVASPTYAIVHLYEGDPPLRHLDLYRLDSERDLEGIGWRDLYFAPGITLVEWIDRIPEAVPEAGLDVALAEAEPPGGSAPGTPALDGARRITITARGEPLRVILDALSATVLASYA